MGTVSRTEAAGKHLRMHSVNPGLFNSLIFLLLQSPPLAHLNAFSEHHDAFIDGIALGL